MKIKALDFEKLKQCIETTLNHYGKDKLVKQYQSGQFVNSNKVNDLQMRFCFDILHLTSRDIAGFRDFINKTLYEYMNDDHLYTALKLICPKITRQY